MGSLKDKVIVITGGARGIGLSIAEAYLQQGAHLALAGRSINELEKAKQKFSSYKNSKVIIQKCDVTSQKDVDALFQRTQDELGTLFGLVAAAGIYGEIGEFKNCDIEKWSEAIDINLIGMARSVHTALKYMKHSGGGRIVLFSGGGQNALPHFSSYACSKGAVWRFTDSVATELQKNRIYMNAIAPGAVNTQFVEDLIAAGPEKAGLEEYNRALEQKKKGGHPPEKAAALACWLMSKESEGLYGKTLSALWDDYKSWKEFESLNHSDIYTFKRVLDVGGQTRFVKGQP